MSYSTGFRDSDIAPRIPLADKFLPIEILASSRRLTPVLPLHGHRIDRSILVIDDDQAVLRVFTRLLSKEGYRVRTARTGHTALRILHDAEFDLVIVDMGLPDIDGAELIRAIRTEAPYAPILA